MSGAPLLDRAALFDAFELLDRALSRRRVVADVFLYGGAAMLLAYGAERSTRDADSVFRPDGPVLDAAREVADELGLPRGWLNQQASSYLPRAAAEPEAAFDRPVYDGPNLRVSALRPDLLLAMKVYASRPNDIADIAVLALALDLGDVDAVLELASERYGGQPLPDRAQPAVEEALEGRAQASP
ncbi:MAG: DUF6036 family nucleotidyltransferase [Egibacteraceae bacterium]